MKTATFSSIARLLLLPLKVGGAVLFFYVVQRLLFFFFNLAAFEQFSLPQLVMTFVKGIRFDVAVISMIQGLLLLLLLFHPFRNGKLRWVWLFLFVVSITPTFLLNCVDMAFFAFQGKRTTADLLLVLNTGEDAGALLPKYIKDFWYVVIIWLAMVFLCTLLVKYLIRHEKSPLNESNLRVGLAFIILVAFIFIGARGSFELRPLSPIFAARDQPGLAPLQLNSPFVFIKSVGKSGIKEALYFDWNSLSKENSPIGRNEKPSSFEKKNVVIIVVESLGAEYMDTYNPGKGLTPFLDSLAQQSTTFVNAFSNGKTSIQGIPSVFSGMPSLFDGAFITSPFGSNETEGIPGCLKNWGYSTAFFHGGKNGTMGFDTYALTAGFQHYYGKNEYPNPKDFDGSWGIFDGPFLSFAGKKISEMKEPFLAGIFTISSHHPYRLPEDKQNQFKQGPLPNSQSIRYADDALKQFFHDIKDKTWYANTLFVLTADHTSIAGSAYFGGPVGMFKIPLILFEPNSIGSKQKISKPVQQIEIQNMVLEKVGYPIDYFSFGSMLAGKVIMRNNGMTQVFNDTLMYQFDGEQVTGLFYYHKDSMATENRLENTLTPIQKQLEKEVKTFLQIYSVALNRNLCTSKKWINFMQLQQNEK